MAFSAFQEHHRGARGAQAQFLVRRPIDPIRKLRVLYGEIVFNHADRVGFDHLVVADVEAGVDDVLILRLMRALRRSNDLADRTAIKKFKHDIARDKAGWRNYADLCICPLTSHEKHTPLCQ